MRTLAARGACMLGLPLVGRNRVFFPQHALETWVEEGKARLVGETLAIPGGHRLELQGALRFTAELTESGDPHGLVGKVKTLEDVEALQGEHSSDSVVIGDEAYEVVEGFLATPDAELASDADGSDPITRFLTGS